MSKKTLPSTFKFLWAPGASGLTRHFARFCILVLGVILVSCQNGTVTLRALDIKVTGIDFEPRYLNYIAPSIEKFTLQGLCSANVQNIYYRYHKDSPFKAISGENGALLCQSNGTFTFEFQSTIAALSNASGFLQTDNGKKLQLHLEFYGQTNGYKTNVIPVLVTQLGEIGKNHLTLNPESSLQSPSYKIRGRLTALYQEALPLTSSRFQIHKMKLRAEAE